MTIYFSASNNDHSTTTVGKQGIDIGDIKITDAFALETLCSILQKVQRDHQTLQNLEKRKNKWSCLS